MPITDVHAINFCTTRIRPAADLLHKTYLTAKSIVDQWNAQTLSATITNDASVVVDIASNNGWPVITGQMATAVITRLIEFTTDYEATNNAKLNTVLQVAPTQPL